MAEPMKSSRIGKQAARLLALAALLCCGLPALAQDAAGFPNRPVKIITPTAAGGNIDILARTLAEKLGAAWGQGVVVEPRPGANGMLAAAAVAKAAPDGYTVLFSHSALVQNLLLQPNPPYRLAELAPVSMLALFPIAYGVNTSLGVNSLQELIAGACQAENAFIRLLRHRFGRARDRRRAQSRRRHRLDACALQGRGAGGDRHAVRPGVFRLRFGGLHGTPVERRQSQAVGGGES